MSKEVNWPVSNHTATIINELEFKHGNQKRIKNYYPSFSVSFFFFFFNSHIHTTYHQDFFHAVFILDNSRWSK